VPRSTLRRGDGRRLLVVIAAASAVGAARVSIRYRRDLDAAHARVARVDRRVVPTRWGAVEYAERGDGEPLLVVHGIFQGCDGGLLSVRELCRDHRVIAPSRFGYLGSSIPPGATPAAQADAFVALLDALRIAQVDVIGLSAGSTSVLQLALRHPGRVKHLVVVSGNLPGGRTAVVQPAWARVLYGDPAMWALKVVSPSTMARLAGVPKGFRMTAGDAGLVAEFVESLFPISWKIRGVTFDAYVSNADVNAYELEAIAVPVMLVHARDDELASYDAAARAAARIPAARLISLRSGGHLLLGRTDVVWNELDTFLGRGVAAPAR
jgi:pimeloyl-ACP methyl ester carboxylesterase